MKQKINIANKHVTALIALSGSFLTIIGVVSAADVENQVLSTQNPSTLPHRALQPSQPSQSSHFPISASLHSELTSQSSAGELQPKENLRDGKGTAPEAEDLALLRQRTCRELPPAKTSLPKVTVVGSQGGRDSDELMPSSS